MGVVKRPQLPVDARNAKYFSRCASSALEEAGVAGPVRCLRQLPTDPQCWPGRPSPPEPPQLPVPVRTDRPRNPRCVPCSQRLLSASQVLVAIPRRLPEPWEQWRPRDVHHDFIRRIRVPDGELVGSVYQQECLSGCLCGLTGGSGVTGLWQRRGGRLLLGCCCRQRLTRDVWSCHALPRLSGFAEPFFSQLIPGQ